MKRLNRLKPLILCLSLLLSSPLYAWQHSISLGYGRAQELGESYDNSGFFLQGTLYRFKPLDSMLYFSMDSSVGQWLADTHEHRHLTTAAVSGDFHAYFMPPDRHPLQPYILATFGPAYLSNEHFGDETQGSHLAFQTTLGTGLSYVKNNQGLDFNLSLVHYCNGGLAQPNQGFDIFYVFSAGYLF